MIIRIRLFLQENGMLIDTWVNEYGDTLRFKGLFHVCSGPSNHNR
jgi:hypothetical protein